MTQNQSRFPIKHSPNPRKRGGQPGNINALKHGYYTGRFQPAEIEDVKDNVSPGLQDEIEMFRVFLRRMVEKSDPDASLQESIEIVRVLSMATLALNRLVRTQATLPGLTAMDELKSALEYVLANEDPETNRLYPDTPPYQCES